MVIFRLGVGKHLVMLLGACSDGVPGGCGPAEFDGSIKIAKFRFFGFFRFIRRIGISMAA